MISGVAHICQLVSGRHVGCGAEIITNKGRARVLAQEILAGQVLVETEDMRRIVIDAADVLTVLKREKKPRETQSALAGAEHS